MSILSRILVSIILYAITCSAYAVDSYRYAHVTIDTPWTIFLFLLVIILFPFILMAVLYWYFAAKKTDEEEVEHE